MIWSTTEQGQVTQPNLARKAMSAKVPWSTSKLQPAVGRHLLSHLCPIPLLGQPSLSHLTKLTAQTIASSRKAALTMKSGLCALPIRHFPSLSYFHASDQHLAQRELNEGGTKRWRAHRSKKQLYYDQGKVVNKMKDLVLLCPIMSATSPNWDVCKLPIRFQDLRECKISH